MGGKGIGFQQTAHRWPAFSSTNQLEKANLIVKQKGRRRLHKEQETELPPVTGGIAEVHASMNNLPFLLPSG